MSITSVWRSSSKPVNEHPNIQDRHRDSGSRTGSAEASGILSHVGWTGDGDHNPHQIRSYTGAVNGHLSPVTAAHVGHDRSHAMSIILATGGAADASYEHLQPKNWKAARAPEQLPGPLYRNQAEGAGGVTRIYRRRLPHPLAGQLLLMKRIACQK